MKIKLLLAVLMIFAWIPPAPAVTLAEDIATTIMLRGHSCGGRQVTQVSEREDAKGNKTIRATCPNGIRYLIKVSNDGRVRVKPLR
ncbi:MAG: hypothetical protein ACE5F3_04530 [Mariprofundaceae bacterium]